MLQTSILALPCADQPLIIKVRNDVQPFTYFAHGAAFGHAAFAHQNCKDPDGRGYVSLPVVDAEGRSGPLTVFRD